MSKRAQLEVKKLIKEIDYLRTDLEYKKEIVHEAENEFMQSVASFLEQQPELKQEYERCMDERLSRAISDKSQITTKKAESVEEREENNTLKKLYREIAKATHPDKVDDTRLNEIYIKAGISYNGDDRIEIYSICDQLGIEYEVEPEDVEDIRRQAMLMKDKISMLESTNTWVWHHTEDQSLRKEMVFRFVASQII